MTTSVTATRISDGAIIDAPPELIWKTLRDFSTIAQWHPAVQDCIIEGGGPADRVGAVRAIHLRDGTPLRELVTALSDKDMSYSYSVIESPLPLAYHSSTVSLLGIEGGAKTLATWYVEFRLTQGDPEQMANAIHSSVILPGFQGLSKLAVGNFKRAGKTAKRISTHYNSWNKTKTRKDQVNLCRALDLS